MSRIGKLPVDIPSGVTVTLGDTIKVKGPKGELAQDVVKLVSVEQVENQIVVSRANDSKPARANHGLMRSLLQNMVTGVTVGFTKKLEILGVGYRADVKGSNLVLNLGYSHPITYAIPQGINVQADKGGKITVTGADKCLVGQVAANIRDFRRPDHYKGKGVRYEGEYVRIKAGKSA